jgi:fructose-bisphosphate aldolase class I
MQEIISKLLTPGKGLLAADESAKTITKRFAAIGLASTSELNRQYREMLFTTPAIEEFISGIILFEETIGQTLQGKLAPQLLVDKGIVPGIKVDEGLEPFNGDKEEVTRGLEGLGERLKRYLASGLMFTKWRGAFAISDIFPTDAFLEENLGRMAKFAKISQENNLIPIVEPEILLDGNHTTARCEEISIKVWKKLFEKLHSEGVNLSAILLKTSMVLPGKNSGVKPAPLEIAHATLRALKNAVPTEVPGVLFLSGGQSPDEATANLNEIVKVGQGAPWQLSFSFARALQEEAMQAWGGRQENVKIAQEAFYKRASLVSKARRGEL